MPSWGLVQPQRYCYGVLSFSKAWRWYNTCDGITFHAVDAKSADEGPTLPRPRCPLFTHAGANRDSLIKKNVILIDRK